MKTFTFYITTANEVNLTDSQLNYTKINFQTNVPFQTRYEVKIEAEDSEEAEDEIVLDLMENGIQAAVDLVNC